VPSETPVEFQVVAYGDEVMAAPILVPSTSNCTLATATLAEAVAERVTDDPETVAALDGAVSETDGGVVSGVGDDAAAGAEPPPPPKPGVYPLPGANGNVVGTAGVKLPCPDELLDDELPADPVPPDDTMEFTAARVNGPRYPVCGSPCAA
jgi:hypothetical protein